MNKKESLTLQDVQGVIAHTVDWWVAAISNKGATPKQIEKFKSFLSLEVQLGLARKEYVTLETDYYPEELLAKVAHQSFVRGSLFPQKVFMDISPHEVGVRQNNSARELLFAVQKKTKLINNSKGTQIDISPLS